MIDWLIKFSEQWDIIVRAPLPFVVALIVVAAIIWAVLNYFYRTRLTNSQSEIALVTRQRDDYREKLGGASPAQVPGTPPNVSIVAAAAAASSSTSGPSSGKQEFIESIKMTISRNQLDPALVSTRKDLLAKVGDDLTAQNEVLTYAVASLNIQLGHERNYNLIFGSQLRLMAQMNVDMGVPPSVAIKIYNETKAAFPDAYQTYTFDHWIGFLRNSGLIAIASNGNYVLTAYGRGLMEYILDRHLSVNRPF